MGGGEQQLSPEMQQFQAYQQRQDLAKAVRTGLQGIGAAVGQPIAAGNLAGPRQMGPPGVAATPGPPTGTIAQGIGPLFRPQGGIDETQLAKILSALGYGG